MNNLAIQLTELKEEYNDVLSCHNRLVKEN